MINPTLSFNYFMLIFFKIIYVICKFKNIFLKNELKVNNKFNDY